MSAIAAARALALAVLVGAAATLTACAAPTAGSTAAPAVSSGSVAAVGSADTAGSVGATGPDPCTLLTDREAADLLHAPVTRSGPTPQSRGTVCRWTTGGTLLGVQVYEGRAFFAPDVQAPTGRRLTGIGDDAYVDVHGGVSGALVGDTVVVVDAVGPGTHETVEDLLRTAVGHL